MERRIACRMPLGSWSPERSLCLCSRFFSSLRRVREVVHLGNFWRRQNLPAVVQTSSSCKRGHTAQLVFVIVPDLIPVQLHELLPELLLQSWKLRDVATLGQSLSSHRALEDSTRRSAAFCFLHSSLPALVMFALNKRSPLPSTTNFSKLGPFFPNRSGIRLFGSTNRTT